MILRNYLVSFFGLKKGKSDLNYDNWKNLNIRSGEFKGDLYIVLKEKNHFITEIKDKHLDFRVSLSIEKEGESNEINLITIVKLNNFLGEYYFFLIKPFHRFIVPSILRRLSKII